MTRSNSRFTWLVAILFGVSISSSIAAPPHIKEPPPPPKKSPRAPRPPAPAQPRKKAAEVMIPLPGPGPVQARQEKKRPPGSSGNSFPSPPAKILITKMTYGKDIQATAKDGRKFSFPRWWGNPNDLYELMRRMNRRVPMGFMPRYTSTPLPKFSFNPDEVPVLYITGHYEWSLSDDEVDKIRKYVLSGGFLFINPCCGNESFRKSADRQIPKIFPARPPERLAADHPLFRSYYPVKKVKYLLEKKDAYEESPVLF
ncbi:MAG: DUF4159 domain-containing protein, partial [Planctomycetota bacterium]|nr:DUF4159 domain-containing protein [Planctomycetota bacterium]